MNVNRREFIVTGVAGLTAAAGCNGSSTSTPAPNPGASPPAAPPATPPRNLILDFSGLYGFVFSGTPLALDVLLIDAAQTILRREPHFARLRTDRANIHPSNPTAETGTQKMPVDASAAPAAALAEMLPFWDLKGHRLRLDTPGSASLTKVTGRRDPKTNKPGSDAKVQADVSWLAGMDRIAAKGRGHINPACLGENPSSAKIASRLHFTAGEVSSRFRAPFQEIVWRIESPDGGAPFEQALGELRLTIPVTADTVTFTLEPFAGGAAKQVVLQMKPTGDTRVELVNEPDSSRCRSDADVRRLHHFQAFYELLAPPNASSKGPVPTCPDATCPISCRPLNSQTTYCPGTEYASGP